MKQFCSSVAVLQHLVKRKTFESFSRACPDRRVLFAMVGRHLQMNEETLMCTIGDHMNLPVLKRHSSQFFQTETQELSNSEQERNAFALLTSRSGVRAVACLEPVWLHQYPSNYLSGPLLLCGWELLKTIYRKRADQNYQPIQTPDSKITDSISLENILKRLAFLGVNEGIIEFTDSDVRYEIIAPDLNNYNGILYLSAAPEIEQTLLQAAESSSHRLQKEISGLLISITVRLKTHKRCFRLTWTPLPETLQIQERLNEFLH